MTRITKLPVEAWDPELRSITAADEATSVEQGMMRVLAHTPAIAKSISAFGGGLFGARTLSRRMIELVRLRIAFHNQCRSCMAIRYRTAVDDGLTEGAVCSLERPQDAADLSEAEKAAIAYADRSAIDHFSIDDSTFDGLRAHFTEAQIVELGVFISFFIGFGRLSAAWNMTEDLPEGFRADGDQILAPWAEEALLVRG
jgi:alkylhydroperoxidase family enzyme